MHTPHTPTVALPSTTIDDHATLSHKEIRRRVIELILVFSKIGAFTFGGGYAMVALLENDIVTKRGWLTEGELSDMIAVAESTPGPISANIATFVGYRRVGIAGGIAATLGICFPSWLIIVLISSVYTHFKSNVWIAAPLVGIRLVAIVLVAQAFFRMSRKLPRRPLTFIMLFGALIGSTVIGISSIPLLLIGFIVGMIIHRSPRTSGGVS